MNAIIVFEVNIGDEFKIDGVYSGTKERIEEIRKKCDTFFNLDKELMMYIGNDEVELNMDYCYKIVQDVEGYTTHYGEKFVKIVEEEYEDFKNENRDYCPMFQEKCLHYCTKKEYNNEIDRIKSMLERADQIHFEFYIFKDVMTSDRCTKLSHEYYRLEDFNEKTVFNKATYHFEKMGITEKDIKEMVDKMRNIEYNGCTPAERDCGEINGHKFSYGIDDCFDELYVCITGENGLRLTVCIDIKS